MFTPTTAIRLQRSISPVYKRRGRAAWWLVEHYHVAPYPWTRLLRESFGFARFKGTQLQNEAVKRFRNVFEAAQIGGARACDPAVERVDGGGNRQDNASAIGGDARAEYSAILRALGRVDLKRLEFVTIWENGPTAYARWRTGNQGPTPASFPRPRSRCGDRADAVEVFRPSRVGEGSSASQSWSDGHQPTPGPLAASMFPNLGDFAGGNARPWRG